MASKDRTRFKIQHHLAMLLLILFAYFGICECDEEYRDVQVIYHTSNSFGEIWVYDYEDKRCLSFGNPNIMTTLNQTCIYRENVEIPALTYYRMLLGALYLNPSPKKILMLGLGGGAMVHFLRTLVPDLNQFDIVEINPDLVTISEEYFFLKLNKKTEIFIDDAYHYVMEVNNTKNDYDLIIVDVFDEHYIPSELLSSGFMEILKGVTSPKGGVVAINAFEHSKTHDKESKLVFETFGDFYDLIDVHRVMIACNGDLPSLQLIENNAKKFHQKFKEIRVDEKWLLSKFVVYSHVRD